MTTVDHYCTAIGYMSNGQPAHVSLTLHLHYDDADPLAVRLTFMEIPDRPWIVSRDLLGHGLYASVGEGNVQVSLDGESNQVHVTLKNPLESTSFMFPLDAAVRFLKQTYELVHPGMEQLDLDKEIRDLLSGS